MHPARMLDRMISQHPKMAAKTWNLEHSRVGGTEAPRPKQLLVPSAAVARRQAATGAHTSWCVIVRAACSSHTVAVHAAGEAALDAPAHVPSLPRAQRGRCPPACRPYRPWRTVI